MARRASEYAPFNSPTHGSASPGLPGSDSTTPYSTHQSPCTPPILPLHNQTTPPPPLAHVRPPFIGNHFLPSPTFESSKLDRPGPPPATTTTTAYDQFHPRQTGSTSSFGSYPAPSLPSSCSNSHIAPVHLYQPGVKPEHLPPNHLPSHVWHPHHQQPFLPQSNNSYHGGGGAMGAMGRTGGSHPPDPKNDKPRPFKCTECSQGFNRNHDLKRHKRIHLSVKPYPCGWCDKAFSRKDALKRHLLVKGCAGTLDATIEESLDVATRAGRGPPPPMIEDPPTLGRTSFDSSTSPDPPSVYPNPSNSSSSSTSAALVAPAGLVGTATVNATATYSAPEPTPAEHGEGGGSLIRTPSTPTVDQHPARYHPYPHHAYGSYHRPLMPYYHPTHHVGQASAGLTGPVRSPPFLPTGSGFATGSLGPSSAPSYPGYHPPTTDGSPVGMMGFSTLGAPTGQGLGVGLTSPYGGQFQGHGHFQGHGSGQELGHGRGYDLAQGGPNGDARGLGVGLAHDLPLDHGRLPDRGHQHLQARASGHELAAPVGDEEQGRERTLGGFGRGGTRSGGDGQSVGVREPSRDADESHGDGHPDYEQTYSARRVESDSPGSTD